MRFGRAATFAVVVMLLVVASALPADTPSPVHLQRYCMGTMFDIVAYHSSRAEALPAVERAMAEIVRLDQVLSDYKADSDLSKLNREGSRGFMSVEPSLYEVIEQSLIVSRRSNGAFRRDHCAAAEGVEKGKTRRSAPLGRGNCRGSTLRRVRKNRDHRSGSHPVPR